MDTFRILVRFRPKNPDCASFDVYMPFSESMTMGDIIVEAQELVHGMFTRNYQVDRTTKRICEATDYYIDLGPTLGEMI